MSPVARPAAGISFLVGCSALKTSPPQSERPEIAFTSACNRLWDGKQACGQGDSGGCWWVKMCSKSCDNLRVACTPVPEDCFKSLQGGSAPTMCLRDGEDLMSESFRQTGSFPDCFSLAAWWETLPDRSSDPANRGLAGVYEPSARQQNEGLELGAQRKADGSRGVFVDIGANIGACLMSMLARPDVGSTVAFEPSPANLFYLTSSAAILPQERRDRLFVYTEALGDGPGTHYMYTQKNNAGNSVLDTAEGTQELWGDSGGSLGRDSDPAFTVNTTTLDEIFMRPGTKPPYIHLLKIDAQGYEPKILKGAVKLFESGAINAVKLELDSKALKAQGSSPAEYLNMYIDMRYEFYSLGGARADAKPYTDRELRGLACKRTHSGEFYADVIALRKLPGEPMTQVHVDCSLHHR